MKSLQPRLCNSTFGWVGYFVNHIFVNNGQRMQLCKPTLHKYIKTLRIYINMCFVIYPSVGYALHKDNIYCLYINTHTHIMYIYVTRA